MLVEKEIKNIYYGTSTFPTEWKLRDESIVASSTASTGQQIASTNGKLFRPFFVFGGGNGNFSISTVDGHTCFTSRASHGNICIGVNQTNLNDLMSHSKINIVTDAWNFGSLPSSYGNSINIGFIGLSYNSGWNDVVTQNSFNIEQNTWYSSEVIIYPSTKFCEITIKKLADGTEQTGTYTASSWRTDTSSQYILNGGGTVINSSVVDAYGGPIYFSDFHIYYRQD